jgi:hypothetical protein
LGVIVKEDTYVKNLHIWLLVALLIGGGALMACKSSKKSTTTKPTATTGSSATKVSNATKASDTTPSSTGGDASAALAALESKAATKEVKAAYNFSTTSAGTTTPGTFTLYSKPPDWRFDFSSGSTTGSIISVGGKSYFCTPEGGGACIESSSLSQVPFPFLSIFTDPTTLSSMIGANLSDVNINRSSKTVAGQSADCFAVAGGAAGAVGTGEVCLSSDGVLLSITANSAGTEFSLEATSVSGTVSASDLTPPYPIQSVPGAP